jgi:hypothetical protein
VSISVIVIIKKKPKIKKPQIPEDKSQDLPNDFAICGRRGFDISRKTNGFAAGDCKMKAIIKYQAKDNCEFINEKDCIEYEQRIDRVDAIMARLPKPPENDGCNFANGHGYIQHDKETLKSVWNDLLDEFKTKIEHKWLDESKDMIADASWVARLVGDYDIKPYWKAWNRMSNIERTTCREFGQPFYATHPDKAELVEIVAAK